MRPPDWIYEVHKIDGFVFGRRHTYIPASDIQAYEVANKAVGVVVPGQYVKRFPDLDAAKQYVVAVANLRG